MIDCVSADGADVFVMSHKQSLLIIMNIMLSFFLPVNLSVVPLGRVGLLLGYEQVYMP